MRIAVLREAFDHRAAGVAEVQDLRRLVERFARGVVERGPGERHLPVFADHDQRGVAAGDDHGEHREEVRIAEHDGVLFEERAVDMRGEMVDRDQRQLVRGGDPLGEVEADEQRRDQPGRMGHSHGVEVVERHARRLQRLVQGRADRGQVGACGEFRDDAAVRGVFGDLGRHRVGQDPFSVLHDRHGGFIAAGFDPQDQAHIGSASRLSDMVICSHAIN